MAVNEQEVRSLLDEAPASSISSDSVNSHISRATLLVNNVKNASATQNMIDEAIKAIAVWTVYGAYTEGIAREIGSVPDAVQTKLNHFRKIAELFLAQVSGTPIDLENPVESNKGNEIPVDPSVASQTTSEAW
jgi:hypothetical protein